MELPRPASAVVALAAFVRARLTGVTDTLAPLWTRFDGVDVATARDADSAARNLTTVIIGAAAPFAPTSYARARLLRQLHAAGLLTEQEAEHAVDVLDIAQ